MSFTKAVSLLAIVAFAHIDSIAQNVQLNILSQNAGIVKKGQTLFIQVNINNTDPKNHIGIYKIRTQISVPQGIVSIADKDHVLPTGWTISSNNGGTINLSNGKDMIAANDGRVILIAIKGIKLGGPETITGQLSFADGTAPGTATGTLKGDLAADNFSTTTCTVIK
jgi:hypothetical protein